MATDKRKKFEYKDEQLRKYTFPTEPIPRMSIKDPKANERIAAGLPVILKDADLVAPALKWDMEFMERNMGEGDFCVFEADNHKFLYFDDKKMKGHPNFIEPTTKIDIKFPEFVMRLKNWKPGDKRLYLQQALNDTVGRQVVVDFLNFNWSWANNQQKQNKWGDLTNNLLLVSQEGNVTPCHFDEQENFFCQVYGLKRVILFPPEQFDCLYPYPVHHPSDRQSMVDFENPDFKKFPRFKEAHAMSSVLAPGDVLYLPMYWFHHFESLLNGGPTVSITFWYKGPPTGDIVYPLKAQQKMAMMRNIEKMITEALGDHHEVGPFMRSMVLGRYSSEDL